MNLQISENKKYVQNFGRSISDGSTRKTEKVKVNILISMDKYWEDANYDVLVKAEA